MEKGLILNIQGYSVHDGSGCRTLVFLSGCPLRCTWCSNPEGQLLRPRVLYRKQKCRHTHYRCVKACPHQAIRIASPFPQLDRSLCVACDTMDCVKACLNEALQIAGRFYSADELLRILIRDSGFWGSNGGVTFGGGEPLLQADFLLTVLGRCRANYIHTTVETSAYADPEIFINVLKLTDAMFIDIKHMNSNMHRMKTGVENELILQNIAAAASSDWHGRLIIRIPIVPGYNDSAENMQATADLMLRLALTEVNLLPFHRLGQSKYEQLGLNYEYAHTPAPSQAMLTACQAIFENAGIHCYVGSETPF